MIFFCFSLTNLKWYIPLPLAIQNVTLTLFVQPRHSILRIFWAFDCYQSLFVVKNYISNCFIWVFWKVAALVKKNLPYEFVDTLTPEFEQTNSKIVFILNKGIIRMSAAHMQSVFSSIQKTWTPFFGHHYGLMFFNSFIEIRCGKMVANSKRVNTCQYK